MNRAQTQEEMLVKAQGSIAVLGLVYPPPFTALELEITELGLKLKFETSYSIGATLRLIENQLEATVELSIRTLAVNMQSFNPRPSKYEITIMNLEEL